MTDKCGGHYVFTPTERPGYDRISIGYHDLAECPRDGPRTTKVDSTQEVDA